MSLNKDILEGLPNGFVNGDFLEMFVNSYSYDFNDVLKTVLKEQKKDLGRGELKFKTTDIVKLLDDLIRLH